MKDAIYTICFGLVLAYLAFGGARQIGSFLKGEKPHKVEAIYKLNTQLSSPK